MLLQGKLVCNTATKKSDYIPRTLALTLRRAAHEPSPLLLEGPRGSGKTTLLRNELPHLSYITLNDPRHRLAARQDPDRFLARIRSAAIVDDAHRAPQLVDRLGRQPRHIVLAASRRLNGNLRTLRLYPPTRAERSLRAPLPLQMIGRFAPAATTPRKPVPWPVQPLDWEHELRGQLDVRDLDRFAEFAEAARALSGTVFDAQALARSLGLSRTTVVRWMAVLDACFLTLWLRPLDDSLGRRTVRAPKLHFLDSPLIESSVASELHSNAVHRGEQPQLRYWRDSNGFEIPLIIDNPGEEPVPVAISEHPGPPEVARLRRWMTLAGVRQGAMIGRTAHAQFRRDVLEYSLDQL